MKYIKCAIGNNEMNLRVEKSASFSKRAACAEIIAEAVMGNDGIYRPWAYDIHYTIFILSTYTDFVFPEEWGDNELFSFSRTAVFKEIESLIDEKELKEVEDWVGLLVEYRQKCYENNILSRFVAEMKNTIGLIVEGLKEDPEIINLLKNIPLENKLQ